MFSRNPCPQLWRGYLELSADEPKVARLSILLCRIWSPTICSGEVVHRSIWRNPKPILELTRSATCLASSLNEQVNQNDLVLPQNSLVIREIVWIARFRSPLCDQNALFVPAEAADGVFSSSLELDRSRVIREFSKFRPILRFVFEA